MLSSADFFPFRSSGVVSNSKSRLRIDCAHAHRVGSGGKVFLSDIKFPSSRPKKKEDIFLPSSSSSFPVNCVGDTRKSCLMASAKREREGESCSLQKRRVRAVPALRQEEERYISLRGRQESFLFPSSSRPSILSEALASIPSHPKGSSMCAIFPLRTQCK